MRSSRPARPIWWRWRARCSTTRAGRGMPPRSWARRSTRRRSTGAASRAARASCSATCAPGSADRRARRDRGPCVPRKPCVDADTATRDAPLRRRWRDTLIGWLEPGAGVRSTQRVAPRLEEPPMISVSYPNPAPIGGRGDFDGPLAPHGEEAPATGADTGGGGGTDPLARFGAENGLHAQAQALVHEGPHAAGAAQPGAATNANHAQAQQLMDEGLKLLMARKYDAAIAKFQEGYRLYPSQAFVLNEAAALRDSGRYAEATLAYERYLADPDAPRADEARQTLEETRSHLGGRTYTTADIVEAKRLIDEGSTAYREGRYQDAYNAWGEAYEHNPLPALLHSQATCMEQLGANYTAARLFRDYANADPKPKDAAEFSARADRRLESARREPITAGGMAGGMEWMARGNELLFAHRYGEAIAAFDQGFQTYPSENFILNKASSLLDAGRYAEADLAYGRYLGNPEAPRADEARAAQLRAREHMGGREATVTGVAESQRLMGEGEA